MSRSQETSQEARSALCSTYVSQVHKAVQDAQSAVGNDLIYRL
jgi:hypothetical protein